MTSHLSQHIMNESHCSFPSLSVMGERIKGLCAKHGNDPCLHGKVINQDVYKEVMMLLKPVIN